jgi:tetratricopeptide (TPR) repeat protein
MPSNHDIQELYARQLGVAGKVDEAVKLADAQKTGKAAEDRDAYLAEADILWRAKRWKEASAAVDKAEAVGPKSDEWIISFYRGEIAERQKNYDVAEAEFRKGLVGSPDNPSIENYLGYMLADRGVKLDEALSLLKKAVAAEPQNYAYLDSLAWAYYKQGQYALAESYARKAVTRMSWDPTLLDHLGEIEAKTGKLQDAIGNWEKSLKEYATSLAPEADPADVGRVQKKLETARVKLAKVNAGAK